MYEQEVVKATQAEKEISKAWQTYKATEKYGLEFGRVCCEWRDKFKQKKTGPQSKGTGFIPILEQTGIPTSTAYWWMERYEISVGKKQTVEEPQKPTSTATATFAETSEPEKYTPEEYAEQEQGVNKVNELEALFPKRWTFHIKANCAQVVPHYDVVFSALPEELVRELAETLI